MGGWELSWKMRCMGCMGRPDPRTRLCTPAHGSARPARPFPKTVWKPERSDFSFVLDAKDWLHERSRASAAWGAELRRELGELRREQGELSCMGWLHGPADSRNTALHAATQPLHK